MRVCGQTTKAAPQRMLRYRDLKVGDVFRWKQQTNANDRHVIRDEQGHTYLTGSEKGTRYTQSYLTDGNYPVVVYPDACLEPGEAVTTTSKTGETS